MYIHISGTGKSMSLICSSLRWLKENAVYVPVAHGIPYMSLFDECTTQKVPRKSIWRTIASTKALTCKYLLAILVNALVLPIRIWPLEVLSH